MGVLLPKSALGGHYRTTPRRRQEAMKTRVSGGAAALAPPPAGGVLFSSSYVADGVPESSDRLAEAGEDGVAPAVHPEEAIPGSHTPKEEPDEAANKAAGPPADLAIAVARQLTNMAGDVHDIGGSRANTLSALRLLLPRLPAVVVAELVPDILKISRDPELSEADQFEINTDTGLSRSRIRTGAKDLAGVALVTAAEAFAEGRNATVPADDADRTVAEEVIALAAELLRGRADESQNPLLGALSVIAVARSAPDFALYATGLLFHGDEHVRALGARYALGSPDLFRAMARDPSPHVRASVAGRAPELPEDVRERLASDTHLIVRRGTANSTK